MVPARSQSGDGRALAEETSARVATATADRMMQYPHLMVRLKIFPVIRNFIFSNAKNFLSVQIKNSRPSIARKARHRLVCRPPHCAGVCWASQVSSFAVPVSKGAIADPE